MHFLATVGLAWLVLLSEVFAHVLEWRPFGLLCSRLRISGQEGLSRMVIRGTGPTLLWSSSNCMLICLVRQKLMRRRTMWPLLAASLLGECLESSPSSPCEMIQAIFRFDSVVR
jgi:hypothetical protein